MRVMISKKIVEINPQTSVGKGGEADVYLVGKSAVKIFKEPGHLSLIHI